MKTLSLIFGALALAAVNPVVADVLVDDFQDGNLTVESLGGAWFGASSPGLGLSYRTRQSFPIGASDKDAELFTSGTLSLFRYGKNPETGIFSTIAPSDRTNTAEKLQFAGLNIALGAAYDASAFRYLRFTAYLADPQPSWSNLGLSQFVVQFGEPSPSPNNAIGPWTEDGTAVQGVPITTTPTSFLVPLDDANRLKVDPVFTAIFGSSSANLANLGTLAFGFRRASIAQAGTNNLGGMFFLDNIILHEEAPGIDVVAPGTAIDESGPGNSTTFSIALTGLPSDPVTVNVATTATLNLTVSPASWTFLPSGTPGPNESLWSDPASITVTAIDNGDFDDDTTYTLALSAVSEDLFYNGLALPEVEVAVINDDFPAQVPGWIQITD